MSKKKDTTPTPKTRKPTPKTRKPRKSTGGVRG